MADSDSINSDKKSRNFICGVVEGFYGRPWTTEQRKDLFRKLKKWGMDSYVYAPKDDYKHRAYWRELYTVEEADHLTGLISAAKEQGIVFYYALSPGLDMTYSNPKEVLALKRKLDQVSQFGCEAFALLFDDIESELSKPDKEVFKTFANAQVSVTNEIFNHLNGPKFLFCPTQYCSSRAVPSVTHSEYLNTLGSKLSPEIDIMWTGSKVISKNLNIELIQEITEILRRPPVIWDNLHANDYDQKRVFLGPYSGRSPELIPLLRGVLTNPNCEFHANTIAIHTLAHWSKCSLDSKVNNSLSADIKLETENDDGVGNEDIPSCLSKNIYHPRVALKNAILEWLPEFSIQKEAWGPISKPQPPVTMVMPIMPIIPSINTCMSLTTTTTTTSSSNKTAMPEVNTNQLQALADVCSTVNVTNVTPISNAIMNSLVSPTKVITNDAIPNPIAASTVSNIEIPKKIPISSIPIPIMNINKDVGKPIDIDKSDNELDVDCSSNVINKDDVSTTTIISDSFTTNSDTSDATITTSSTAIVDVIPVVSTSTTNELLGEGFKSEIPTEIENTENIPNSIAEDKSNLISNEIEEDITIPECDECVTTTSKIGDNDVNSAIVSSSDDTEIRNIEDEEIKTNGLQSFNVEEKTLKTNNGITESMHEENSSLHSFTEPMECGSSSVNSQGSPKNVLKCQSEDVVMSETVSTSSGSMQVESSDNSLVSNAEMSEDYDRTNDKTITVEDLYLLCDLFYLPFEHGSRALQLLNEFYWLKSNAHVLLENKGKKNEQLKPEVQEWMKRSEKFSGLCQSVHLLSRKIACCANKELCYDLFSYVWDIAGVMSLLNAFVKWLSLGNFPSNINSYTQGSYTWFSKGWKETFMSGDQEPWVFRGGLTADLQRLMPVDSGNDLFMYKLPDVPTTSYYIIRPYNCMDEEEVYSICHKTCRDGSDCSELFPDNLQGIPADRLVGPFITMNPELCMIVQNSSSNKIIGYACAALDARLFYRNQEMCWLPAMCEKYPLSLLDDTSDLTQTAKDSINHFHNFKYECPQEVLTSHPSIMTCCILKDEAIPDPSVGKRLITVVLAALRSNGSFGVHVCINQTDNYMFQFYSKLGFQEIYRDTINNRVYLGRNF